MPFYLSSYVDDGQNLLGGRTCRPRGSDQPGWSAIDIRPDGGASIEGNGLNACLLYLPKHDPSLYQMADEKEEVLGRTVLSRLLHRLNLNSPFQRFHECVADLLLDPPGNGWQPLRGTRIYLGGLLWQMPVMAGGTTLSETWTHADTNASNADSLNSTLTWTKSSATGNWYIHNSAAAYIGAADLMQARAESDLSTNNCEVTMTVVALSPIGTGSNLAIALCAARMRAADFTYNYYYGPFLSGSGATNNHQMAKFVASVETFLGLRMKRILPQGKSSSCAVKAVLSPDLETVRPVSDQSPIQRLMAPRLVASGMACGAL
jgi:hypothetical protein